jgi:transposase-like protein
VPALREFFGSSAGLSASAIGRLAEQWQAEHAMFARRDLADRDFVYCWADGTHFTLRLAGGRLCALVIVGVRADGTKELVAVAQGTRESTEDWAGLLRDLRRRGMLRVLPPLQRDARTQQRDPHYWVTLFGLVLYAVIVLLIVANP